MDFFTRITPVYKSTSVTQGVKPRAQLAAPSGLSSLIGSLFGSATPAYKTADGAGARAPAQSPSFWSMFAVTPSYKTAPAAPVAEAEDIDLGVDEDACASDPDRGPDQIVLL
jgi:transcription elongation factor